MQTINEYICEWPPEIQEILQKIRQTIRDHAPDAEEAISYQMPTFRLNGNLVHFAAYKKPYWILSRSFGISRFKERLSGYHHAKGSV